MASAVLLAARSAIAYASISLGVTNSYYQLVLTLAPVWAVSGLSWNPPGGYTGLISTVGRRSA